LRAQQTLQRAGRVEALRALPKNTTIRLAVALLGAIACAGALGACGDSSGAAQSLLNDTFSGHTQIESGDVNLSFALSATGSGGAAKPLAVRLSGPFQNAGTPSGAQVGKFPRFALQLELSAAGHALQAGATSTGSALFVELAGTWFSTPQSTYEALQEGYAQATKTASTAKGRSTFAALGIEPGHWLSNPTNAGTATIAGVQTIHLTAGVDIPALLADVSKLSQAGGALGASAVPGAGTLSPTLIDEVAKSVKSAHVDVYTGQGDHLLRRLEVSAIVSGTPQTQGVLGGLSSAEVKVLLEFTDLNKPQTIVAPPNPQPSSQLLPALQQLAGVLQAVGGSSSSSVR
jgi:hypothetical protein